MNRIYVISLHRPWAEWVMLGWKTIETRTHARFFSLVGKRIGIHAAQKWDSLAIAAAQRWLTPAQIEASHQMETDAKGGTLLGTVRCNAVRRLSTADSAGALIECGTKRFGLFLTEIEEFPKPIPMRGYQGMWSAII